MFFWALFRVIQVILCFGLGMGVLLPTVKYDRMSVVCGLRCGFRVDIVFVERLPGRLCFLRFISLIWVSSFCDRLARGLGFGVLGLGFQISGRALILDISAQAAIGTPCRVKEALVHVQLCQSYVRFLK